MHLSFCLVYMFSLHFVADFLLQSREMGKKKSEVFSVLVDHLTIQWLVVGLGLFLITDPTKALAMTGINAVVHGVIDWNVWRLYKKYVGHVIQTSPNNPLITSDPLNPWKYYEDHWFYATIGFDQFLHISTLALIGGLFL
jgi:hypothetical protein